MYPNFLKGFHQFASNGIRFALGIHGGKAMAVTAVPARPARPEQWRRYVALSRLLTEHAKWTCQVAHVYTHSV